jgi:hypothetical protein
LTSKPLDDARSLVAGSGHQQLSLFTHGHKGKRVSSHLAGLEQGNCRFPLNFSKGFPLFFSPYQGFQFFPLCGFIEGLSQERVVRDPDSAETHCSPKLSDLLAGLGGQNGTDGLFSLGAKPELPL